MEKIREKYIKIDGFNNFQLILHTTVCCVVISVKIFIWYDLLFQALESTQKGERIPSAILEKDEKGFGKLFLGGFKTALNEDFIKMEKLGGIVNTVGDGLFTLFGAKLEVCELGIDQFVF